MQAQSDQVGWSFPVLTVDGPIEPKGKQEIPCRSSFPQSSESGSSSFTGRDEQSSIDRAALSPVAEDGDAITIGGFTACYVGLGIWRCVHPTYGLCDCAYGQDLASATIAFHDDLKEAGVRE